MVVVASQRRAASAMHVRRSDKAPWAAWLASCLAPAGGGIGIARASASENRLPQSELFSPLFRSESERALCRAALRLLPALPLSSFSFRKHILTDGAAPPLLCLRHECMHAWSSGVRHAATTKRSTDRYAITSLLAERASSSRCQLLRAGSSSAHHSAPLAGRCRDCCAAAAYFWSGVHRIYRLEWTTYVFDVALQFSTGKPELGFFA